MVDCTLTQYQPTPYTPVENVETPVVLVDIPTMEANIKEYSSFASEQGITLRSHAKTHKNPELARKQIAITDGGIVCQTLGEVEVMAQSGIDDIYLSHTVVQPAKLQRLIWLSRKLERFATTVDCRGNIEPLQTAAADHGETLDVILEVNVGLDRTGVPFGEPALKLSQLISSSPNLNFRGLLAYEANVKSQATTREDYEKMCLSIMDRVESTVSLIEENGITVPEVKVGGTSTSKYSGMHPVVTEINPGMYPFMDVGEINHRPFDVSKEDCAATVLTTVVSKPSPDRVIVDAGSKTISMDKPQSPLPKHRDDISYENYSEEHGWIDTSESIEEVRVGDRLEFIIPHVCTTINLHDEILGIQNDRVEEIWNVTARGKVK